MNGYVDFGAKKDCYALMWSYGEICVGCGCCSDDALTRTKARIAYNEEQLKENKHFKLWDKDNPEIYALQKENVKKNIKYFKEELAKLRKELAALEGKK